MSNSKAIDGTNEEAGLLLRTKDVAGMWISSVWLYSVIARENLRFAEDAAPSTAVLEKSDVARIASEQPAIGQSDAIRTAIERRFRASARADKHSLIAIVFAQMALEAYANEYAVRRLGKGFFKSYIERLELKSKLVLLPALIVGTQLKEGGQALALVKKLKQTRNKLVHAKPITLKSNEDAVDKLRSEDWLDTAKEATKTLDIFAEELERIDPTEKSFLSQLRAHKMSDEILIHLPQLGTDTIVSLDLTGDNARKSGL